MGGFVLQAPCINISLFKEIKHKRLDEILPISVTRASVVILCLIDYLILLAKKHYKSNNCVSANLRQFSLGKSAILLGKTTLGEGDSNC